MIVRSLPAQVIDVPGGVLVRRGVTVVQIAGQDARVVAETLLAATVSGIAKDDLVELFPPSHREVVAGVVDNLVARRVLILDSGRDSCERESPLDVLRWNLGFEQQQLNTRIGIIGVNPLGVAIWDELTRLEFASPRLLDDPALAADETTAVIEDREPVSREDEGALAGRVDVVIAASDFGGASELRHWNRRCVRDGIVFVAAVLQDLVGYVGPIVIPGETACFECARARQNSLMADPALERAHEQHARKGRPVVAYAPAAISLVASLTALELFSFLSHSLPLVAGELLEAHSLIPRVVRRRVLPVPGCSACEEAWQWHPA